MSHKQAKRIRRELFARGVEIAAEPYQRTGQGQVISAAGRRIYQAQKKARG